MDVVVEGGASGRVVGGWGGGEDGGQKLRSGGRLQRRSKVTQLRGSRDGEETVLKKKNSWSCLRGEGQGRVIATHAGTGEAPKAWPPESCKDQTKVKVRQMSRSRSEEECVKSMRRDWGCCEWRSAAKGERRPESGGQLTSARPRKEARRPSSRRVRAPDATAQTHSKHRDMLVTASCETVGH